MLTSKHEHVYNVFDSSEIRNNGRTLVIVSFLILLIAREIINVTEGNLLGLKIEVGKIADLLWILLSVGLYLLIFISYRAIASYNDYLQLDKIEQQRIAPEIEAYKDVVDAKKALFGQLELEASRVSKAIDERIQENTKILSHQLLNDEELTGVPLHEKTIDDLRQRFDEIVDHQTQVCEQFTENRIFQSFLSDIKFRRRYLVITFFGDTAIPIGLYIFSVYSAVSYLF